MLIEYYFCTACKTTLLRRDIEWKIEHEEIRGTRESIASHPELEAIAMRCPNCSRIFAMTFKKKKKRRRRSKQAQKTLTTEIQV
ncbi:MAG: hypothetical protein ACFFDT_15165 [Candidatus Hodarchaeota archaeon]